MTWRLCACGCGRGWEVATATGRRRQYAEDCPNAEALRLQRKRDWYERKRDKSPRHCRCGCGLELPRRRGLQYVPGHDVRLRARNGGLPVAPVAPSQRCRVCEGMSWRVEGEFCQGCGQPYAPEEMPPLESYITNGCGLGMIDD